MRNYNAENERIKRVYFIYLKEARRLSEHSIDAAAASISRLEEYTKYRDFKRFHTQQAVGFKRRLAGQISQRTGEHLSKSTVFTTLNALRAFFQWLAGQPGYRSSLTYSDSDYFNLSEKEARLAKASPEKKTPSIEQIMHVLHAMPTSSAIEKRNRAVIAFILLTGVRDGAAASLKLKHVDLAEGKVVQDAREVRTKFSKTFTTWFFPVGDEVGQEVFEWVSFLQRDMVFSPDEPLFPATKWSLARSPVRTGRAIAFALVNRLPDPEDLQRGVHKSRASLLPSALVPPNPGPAWGTALPYARRVQGLEPKPRPRDGADNVFELRRGCARPSGQVDPPARSTRVRNLPIQRKPSSRSCTTCGRNTTALV